MFFCKYIFWSIRNPKRLLLREDEELTVCFEDRFVAEVGFERPTRKYSRLARVRAARSRCSLFSPLSLSLYLALRALALQAHSLPVAKRRRRSWWFKSHTEAKKTKDTEGVPAIEQYTRTDRKRTESVLHSLSSFLGKHCICRHKCHIKLEVICWLCQRDIVASNSDIAPDGRSGIIFASQTCVANTTRRKPNITA